MIHSGSPSHEILFGGSTSMACASNGELYAEELHGFFAADTRVLSTYRLTIAGHAWRLLAYSRDDPSRAQWDMQNPPIRVPGGDLPEGVLHLRIRRQVSGALHDDLAIASFAERRVPVRIALQLDADFADLFQVKDRSMPPRLNVQRIPRDDGMLLLYERKQFRRGLHIRFEASCGPPSLVGTQFVFDVMLEPHETWRCCVEAVPDVEGTRLDFVGDPHANEHAPEESGRISPASLPDANDERIVLRAASLLSNPFERGRIDLDRLMLRNGEELPFLAAGAPWFMALFGRDLLITSLMSGLLGSNPARGALAALGATQAREEDAFRDAEPGKIAHELRRGELARFGLIPHTPYYGTHDAPALYVLALWNAFRWTGDRELLEQHRSAAEAALHWCETLGDEDGDGLLEYRTRSKKGYRNQGWKDSGEAIPHADGPLAEPPLATVELQGYWYAAQLAMAELFEEMGETEKGDRLRSRARALRSLVEERFWMEDEGTYGLAIDAEKKLVRSIASNAGHLLWCGLPSPERARRVAERLLQEDMNSGYGIRTISAEHPRYNPLSYQVGSVWPHDNALIAAGFARYGLREEAAAVFKSILDAAEAFEESRLPELFCGFPRSNGSPVPYEKANVPQGWAAAVPVLATQVFLGLLPDAAHGRCFLSPWLPDWLPELQLSGVPVGNGTLEVRVKGAGGKTKTDHASHSEWKIVQGSPSAPLWGEPFGA